MPRQATTAEGITCDADGEKLSIGLLDAIAIHSLVSIDKKLLGIVKTEFATELKSKRLCQMVKPIAQSIDELLVRYEKKDQVAMLTSKNANPQPTYQDDSSKD